MPNAINLKATAGRYCEQAKKVLEALLYKYDDEGISTIVKIEELIFDEMGTPNEMINQIGNKEKYL